MGRRAAELAGAAECEECQRAVGSNALRRGRCHACYERARRAGALPDLLQARTCLRNDCLEGVPSRRALYCSMRCGRLDRYVPSAKRPSYAPKQLKCGNPACYDDFTSNLEHAAYCSPTCRATVHATRRAAYLATPEGRVKAAEYARQQRARHPGSLTSSEARRRARVYDAAAEDINVLEVFERDQWVCQLCLGAVDPEADYWVDEDGRRTTNPEYASLDHIVPLSAGGRHAWSNVQTTHLRCNQKKSVKLAA